MLPASSRASLLLLLLELACGVLAGLEKARVYDITPIGGPVYGDTQITLRGYGLDGVECIFTRPGPNPPPVKTSSCKFEANAPDRGSNCICSTPTAPQYFKLVEAIDPQTGVASMVQEPTSDLLAGPVVVTASGVIGSDFSPFDVHFEYYELNRVIRVDSIEPSAGHPEVSTLVTVHGAGFVDYSGDSDRPWCSFPGPSWNPFMSTADPDYEYHDFTSPATLQDSTTLLCTVPPMGNNSDPVFLEVCLSGHPDRASALGRARRDDFCTSSLVRFDYVDTPRTNLTLWNSSVIAGPISGGTAIDIFGKYGMVDFLTLAPETSGLPDYGRPTCVFGHGLGRRPVRPPTVALTSPAHLRGAKPLQYYLLTELGDNSTVDAHVGRQRMCRSRSGHTSDDRAYCSCKLAGTAEPELPGCGCGCRDLLKRDFSTDFDMCEDRSVGIGAAPDIKCGPYSYAYHRRLEAVPAVSARCVAPAAAASGEYELEFSPNGDVRSTSRSADQAVSFLYYDSTYGAVTPRAAPLDGGTRYVVHGANLATFAIGTKIGAANIYGVPSQVRVYEAMPACFIGGPDRSVGAELLGCTEVVEGWMSGDPEASGCTTVRCQPAPPSDEAATELPFSISLNGQYDSATFIANLAYFDNAAVKITTIVPMVAPISGDTVIRLQGEGFVDLGGAMCILQPTGGARIFVVATVDSSSQLSCIPTETQRLSAGTAQSVGFGLVLNGDLATLVTFTTPFFFVDVGASRIQALQPPAGPIRGGTTVIMQGTNLRACAMSVCPTDPICIFELRTPARGEATTAATSASTRPSASPPRNVTVLGEVRARGGQWVLLCEVPPSGLTSEDVIELPLSETALAVKMTISLLGYVTPETVLSDRPIFRYYDAAVQSLHPRGGPTGGGTMVTVSGRSLRSSHVATAFYHAEAGKPQLANRPECVFSSSPPPAYGDAFGGAAITRYSPATFIGDDRIRCSSPSGAGVVTMYVEAALNGYQADRTRSTVRAPPTFTYYTAEVSHVLPLGGPTQGGTMVTLHGANLADHGGASCRFAFKAAASAHGAGAGVEDVVTSATLVSGTGVGAGAMRCAAPPLDAALKAALGDSLPTSVELELSLNGIATQPVSAQPCDAAASTGAALLASVALAAQLSAGAARSRCWSYFEPASVVLGGVHPLGGPHAGGTVVTLFGAGFHDFGGLGCYFGGVLPAAAASRVDAGELRCVTPSNGLLPSTGRVSVRLSLNGREDGDALPSAAEASESASESASDLSVAPSFTFYNGASIRAMAAAPSGGGALGSTLITIHGAGFSDFGGLRCQFGDVGALPMTNASLRDDGSVVCRTPPYRPVGGSHDGVAPLPSLAPPLPPLPARLPVSVVLNGQAEAQTALPADVGATFTFGSEPCDGLVTLTDVQGALNDGLRGASRHYGGAPRNCSWLISPSHLNSNLSHALRLTLTAVELLASHDSLTIIDGHDAAGAAILTLPSSSAVSEGGMARSGGCDAAAGACLETYLASSGRALIQLRSEPRTDGTSSGFSLTYATVAPPVQTRDGGSLRPAVTQHPDSATSIRYASVGVEGAMSWQNPANTAEVAAEAPSAWPGEPWQWVAAGATGERVPASADFAVEGRTERVSRGEQHSASLTSRPEASSAAVERS